MKTTFILISLFLLNAFSSSAAEDNVSASVQHVSGGTIPNTTVLIVLAGVLVLFFAALALLKAAKTLEYIQKNPQILIAEQKVRLLEYEDWASAKKMQPSIWTKLMGLRPISEEKDIAMEHEFDGIVELNNPTPGWFMTMFYGTIIFAVGYMLYYHVFDYGPLQDEEYAIEMQHAKIDKDKYLASAAGSMDENSVKIDQDKGVLSAGQALYNANCVACHGDKAQGVVGPNLTDEYWLHGGKVSAVFKTIKYGVTDKGMISWEKTMTPKQIAEVTNYLISLKGSKPANPKPPQGEKEG
jgi:cytochrome c oxidase cbb3-type subunit 3